MDCFVGFVRVLRVALSFSLLLPAAVEIIVPRVGLHMGTSGPGFPLRGEFFGFLGLSGSEVVELGAVTFQIVEFPGTGTALADEFHVSSAD